MASNDDDVDCNWCLKLMAVKPLLAKVKATFGAEAPPDPMTIPIGTPLLVRAIASIRRQRGKAHRASSSRPGHAVAVGWTVASISWKIDGGYGWDGDESNAHSATCGKFVRVRFSPRGREFLCFPEDVRVEAPHGNP